MKNNNYIWHTQYLRNSVAYDHDFWYTCVKWWYLLALLLFFFEFFFGGAVRGVKGKSIAQNENNNYSHHMPYLRNSIAYGHDFWYTFGLWWYLQVFFFISGAFRIWGTICQMIVIYGALTSKMIISPGVFFIFWNFNSLLLGEGEGGIKGQKMV